MQAPKPADASLPIRTCSHSVGSSLAPSFLSTLSITTHKPFRRFHECSRAERKITVVGRFHLYDVCRFSFVCNDTDFYLSSFSSPCLLVIPVPARHSQRSSESPSLLLSLFLIPACRLSLSFRSEAKESASVFPLIRTRPFHTIHNQLSYWPSSRLQLQSKLLL